MGAVVVAFTYKHPRAEKARLAAELHKVWRVLLGFLVAVLLLLGGFLLVSGMALGWFVAGLAAVPFMVLAWFHGELRVIPRGKGSDIADLLASDVLGLLPQNPSPKAVALAATSVPSGQFLGARFGITGTMLAHITSDDPQQTAAIWEQALKLKESLGYDEISGGMLAVATLQCFTGYETILSHMQLDTDDVMSGIQWYQHIVNLVNQHKKPRRTGGIARDWSFGWIPLLQRFGQNISAQIAAGGLITTDLEAHSETLDKMIATFGSGGRQNVALIGAPGAGKTTLVQAFAERLLDARAHVPDNLKFRQVFILDSAALIAAAPGRGELENLVMQVLSEAFRAKNIILCLDDAQLFFEEGVGSVDLGNVLLPILEAGNLRVILTMDEQRLLQIQQRNPGLANALNRMNVQPTSKPETIAVLQDKLLTIEHRQKVTYTYHALDEAYRLSERYVHDMAMPGRAIKLLESAASFANQGFVDASSVQKAIEQTMDIKVGVATGESERETLLNMEELIHKRMINQTRAVQVVSDALRRARAGVRNQNRPIGTFLFLGPTGVGKTELAKTLAGVYFGGEQNIVRLDMNEYVRPEDVYRLIADGARDPHSLTAQVMKQPFSVVLLDEIEKAHPQVLTTLLQLLDEGILRDEKNREISFRDAIIIATSNAGADRIREYIERGYQLQQFEQQFVDELINTNQFRPEFLNRFDEMVVFRPLTKEELVQVIDLILNGINATLAQQKIVVAVEQDAKLLLVDRGYDPRLGARPMRRVVQRAVENTVAKQMLAGSVAPGSTITITREQVAAILDAHEQADAIAPPVAPLN